MNYIDPDYNIELFENQYPERAEWLKNWYSKHDNLPNIPKYHTLHFSLNGWSFKYCGY